MSEDYESAAAASEAEYQYEQMEEKVRALVAENERLTFFVGYLNRDQRNMAEANWEEREKVDDEG